MAHTFSEALFAFVVVASFMATVYVSVAFVGIHRFQRRPKRREADFAPAVTILKPVCGIDFELDKNLRSFCEQDYPRFQVVFVLSSPNDPAIRIIERIITDLPDRDIALVVDPRLHGANPKVSNLINAYAAAKHDILIVADSDIRVEPSYLATVTKSFDDPTVGVVTCLYRGVSARNFLSDLACLQINEWFLPGVLVSGLLSGDRYCFGSTMAIRREILMRAGGFESLADVLADDNMIGRFALDQGYKVELSPYIVDNIVEEKNFRGLFGHELRWARTIFLLNPVGHFFSLLMNTISVAAICFVVVELTIDLESFEFIAIIPALFLRLLFHYFVTKSLGLARSAPYWMIPIRDMMSFAVWVASFLGRDVHWRGGLFQAKRDGSMAKVEALETK